MSTTLLNRDLVHVYGDGNTAGVILTPSAAEVLCAYGNDGGSMMKLCDPEAVEDTQCIPGCHTDSTAAWCTESRCQIALAAIRLAHHAPNADGRSVDIQRGRLGTERWLREQSPPSRQSSSWEEAQRKSLVRRTRAWSRSFRDAAERIPILRLDLDRSGRTI